MKKASKLNILIILIMSLITALCVGFASYSIDEKKANAETNYYSSVRLSSPFADYKEIFKFAIYFDIDNDAFSHLANISFSTDKDYIEILNPNPTDITISYDNYKSIAVYCVLNDYRVNDNISITANVTFTDGTKITKTNEDITFYDILYYEYQRNELYDFSLYFNESDLQCYKDIIRYSNAFNFEYVSTDFTSTDARYLGFNAKVTTNKDYLDGTPNHKITISYLPYQNILTDFSFSISNILTSWNTVLLVYKNIDKYIYAINPLDDMIIQVELKSTSYDLTNGSQESRIFCRKTLNLGTMESIWRNAFETNYDNVTIDETTKAYLNEYFFAKDNGFSSSLENYIDLDSITKFEIINGNGFSINLPNNALFVAKRDLNDFTIKLEDIDVENLDYIDLTFNKGVLVDYKNITVSGEEVPLTSFNIFDYADIVYYNGYFGLKIPSQARITIDGENTDFCAYITEIANIDDSEYIAQLLEEIDNLNNLSLQYQETIKSLQTQVNNLDNEIKTLKLNNSSLVQSNESWQERYNALDKRYNERLEEINSLNAQIETLNATISNLQTRLDNLDSTGGDYKTAYENASANLKLVKEQNAELLLQLDKAQKELEELKGAKNELSANFGCNSSLSETNGLFLMIISALFVAILSHGVKMRFFKGAQNENEEEHV